MTTGASTPTTPRRKSAIRATSASCRPRGIFIERAVIAREIIVGWAKRSVPTVQDEGVPIDGGHSVAAAAHPTTHRPTQKSLRPLRFDEPLPFDQPETVCHRAHEIAIVRDQQATRLMVQQFVLQRLLPLDIQMVGRLIEQIEVRLGRRRNSMPRRAFCPPDSLPIGRPCMSIEMPGAREQGARPLIADIEAAADRCAGVSASPRSASAWSQ